MENTNRYKKQYRNKKWNLFAEKVKNRDDYKCIKCNREDVILQVHHLKYKSGLNIWDYPLSDCVTLCKGCHANEHNIGEPKDGWVLLSIEDNGECCSNCERDGCNKPIRYEHFVYHPLIGYKIVGSSCVKFLTKEDKDISKYIKNIYTNISRFCNQSEWLNDITKNGDSFKRSYYRTHELRIFGNYPYFSIQVLKDNGGLVYESSSIYKMPYKTIEQCKELIYLFVKGWTSKDATEQKKIKELYYLIVD
jgi:hypothetical protein